MSQATRLAQDQPQARQGSQTKKFKDRTIQDEPQFEETLKDGVRRSETPEEEEQRRIEEENRKEDAVIAKRKREKEVLSQIEKVPPSLKNKGHNWMQVEERENLRKAIQKKNLQLYASIGIKPQFASVSGTTRDIISGKSGVPLDQVSSHVAKNVRMIALNDSLKSGNFKGGLDDFNSRVNAINNSFQETKSDEKQRRRFTSVKQAQGKAAQGVQQNFVPGSDFSATPGVAQPSRSVAITSTQNLTSTTGLGTTTNPFRTAQPNQALVSPLLLSNQNQNRTISESSKFAVTTPDGRVRTFNTLENAEKFVERFETNKIQESQEIIATPSVIPDKNNFINFLEAEQKVQKFTPDGNPVIENILGFVESRGKAVEVAHQKAIPNTIEKGLLAMTSAANAQVASLINLGKSGVQFVDDVVNNKPTIETKQIPVASTFDSELIGGTIDDGFDQKGTGVKKTLEKIQNQDIATNIGQGAAFTIPLLVTGGVGLIQKGLGIGGKNITIQTTAKSLSGAPVNEAVKASTEFQILGKTVATKTLRDPTTVKITEKIPITEKIVAKVKQRPAEPKIEITPASNKGSISIGKTQPNVVLNRAPLEPKGRGLEVMTGTKEQTRFNVSMVDELVKQGRATKDSSRFTRLVTEGVDLSRKAPSIIHGGVGPKPLQNIKAGAQNDAVVKSLRELQSPKNLLKGQRRIGPIGGSFSQQFQLRPQFRKPAIHDLDIDVRSESIAQRGAKKIVDALKKTEDNDTIFRLSPGRKTKVEVSRDRKSFDETVEFLAKKDQTVGNSIAAESGMRFGEKFRVDKLSQFVKPPIKEPDTGLKSRDIKDQVLAKGASVLSIQGKNTERFHGKPSPELAGFIARKTRLQDAGVIDVSVTTVRGKDTVDLVNIFKSKALDLRDAGKIREGKRLDDIAKEIEDMNPDIDFNANIVGEATEAPLKRVSISTMISANSGKVKTTVAGAVAPSVSVNIRDVHAERLRPRERIPPRDIQSLSARQPQSIRLNISSPIVKQKNIRTASTSLVSGKVSSVKSKSLIPSTKPVSRTSPVIRPVSRKVISTKNILSSKPTSPTTKSDTSKSVSTTTKSGIISSRGGLPVQVTNNTAAVFRTKKVGFGILPEILNTTKKAPGKVKHRRNFVGNVRQDHIVGIFKRNEIIEDKKRFGTKVNKIIQKDKRRFKKKKSNILGTNKRIKF